MIWLINSVFAILFYFSSCFHPVHVSVTNMEYFTDKQQIEYSVKVFKDDFQLLFAHLNRKSIDFNSAEDIDQNIELIKAYFDKNLKLEINNSILKSELLSYNLIEDAVWFKFHAPIKSKILSIKLLNTVLLDLYFDQKNLLIFKAGNFEEGYRFDIKNKEYLIEF